MSVERWFGSQTNRAPTRRWNLPQVTARAIAPRHVRDPAVIGRVRWIELACTVLENRFRLAIRQSHSIQTAQCRERELTTVGTHCRRANIAHTYSWLICDALRVIHKRRQVSL